MISGRARSRRSPSCSTSSSGCSHAAGYVEPEPGATLERDVDVALGRAQEVIRRYEGGLPVGNDDAFQAAAELRDLYKALLDHPRAEAGADLQGLA